MLVEEEIKEVEVKVRMGAAVHNVEVVNNVEGHNVEVVVVV